jgi:phage tail sheath protein FI
MPVTVTYPGVYVQELTNPVRPIVGVPTSVAAFFGDAPRGKADEAVQVNSWSDYERAFGPLDPSVPLSYAVYLFFLNGGNSALIVRRSPGGDPLTAKLSDSITLHATSPGAWAGQLSAEVDHDNLLDPGKALKFNLTLRDRVTGAAEYYPGASIDRTTPRFLPTLLNRSQLAAGEPADPYNAPPEPGIYGFGEGIAQATLGDEDVVLEAFSAGAWGTGLSATVSDLEDKKYRLTITDAGSARTESYEVTAPPDLKTLFADSRLVKPGDGAKFAKLPTVGTYRFAIPEPEAPQAPAGGGEPAKEPPPLGDPDLKTGIYALVKADIFNILCLPAAEPYSAQLLSDAAKFCERHRAMLILDPPTAWADKMPLGFEDVVANPAISSVSPNAAVYYPSLIVTDDLGNRMTLGPSAAMAGVWAATDTQRGVWKAPAGTAATIAGITDLDVHVDDGESGVLNPIAVNTLRTLPLVGPVSWGARTTVGADQLADQWKYIPVRRTALYIEESLRRGTQWVVFEPNDEPLWSSIRLNVGAFMNRLFREGAFQGSTPAEAYLVKCDKDNNPPDQVDIGIVNILVGFAPLKPAEFVIISIQQQAGQV